MRGNNFFISALKCQLVCWISLTSFDWLLIRQQLILRSYQGDRDLYRKLDEFEQRIIFLFSSDWTAILAKPLLTCRMSFRMCRVQLFLCETSLKDSSIEIHMLGKRTLSSTSGAVWITVASTSASFGYYPAAPKTWSKRQFLKTWKWWVTLKKQTNKTQLKKLPPQTKTNKKHKHCALHKTKQEQSKQSGSIHVFTAFCFQVFSMKNCLLISKKQTKKQTNKKNLKSNWARHEQSFFFFLHTGDWKPICRGEL